MRERSTVDPQHVYTQVSWERDCNLVATWTELAVAASDEHTGPPHGRHLSVAFVSRAFEMIRLRIASSYSLADAHTNEAAAIGKLLSHVVVSLRWSLIHSRANCGAYIPLPWVKDIVQCYEAARASHNPGPNRLDPLQTVALTGDQTIPENVPLILRLFETCMERELITGNNIATDIRRIVTALSPITLPALPPDLTLEAIAVRQLGQVQQPTAQTPMHPNVRLYWHGKIDNANVSCV